MIIHKSFKKLVSISFKNNVAIILNLKIIYSHFIQSFMHIIKIKTKIVFNKKNLI